MSTGLVQAVIENDTVYIQKYKHDFEYTHEKDMLGYSPIELAYLLNRVEIIKLLEPQGFCPKILFEKKGKRVVLSSEQFFEQFNTLYVQTIYCSDYEMLLRISKLCPGALARGELGLEMRALGRRFRDNLFSGHTAPVYIKMHSADIGLGLYAARDIETGEYIGEYAGNIRKLSWLHREETTYCLQYPTRWWTYSRYAVDAAQCGNALKFINHSDEPNINPYCLVERRVLHTVFFAERNIKHGEELLFNYGKDYWKTRNKLQL